MSSSEHVLRVRRLYKLIFRLHRALPPELRIMGNNYARDEFKRHKDCKQEEARIFMNEWTDYAINLAKQMKPLNQAKKKTVGMPLDPKLLDHMSDDQIVQLYELHKAAASPSDTPAEHSTEIMESQFNGNGVEEVKINHNGSSKDQYKNNDPNMASTSKMSKFTNNSKKGKGKGKETRYNQSNGYMETQFNGPANNDGFNKK